MDGLELFSEVTKGIDLATPQQQQNFVRIVETFARKEPQEVGFVAHFRGRVLECDEDAAKLMGKTKLEVIDMDYLKIKDEAIRTEALENLAKANPEPKFYNMGKHIIKVTSFYFKDFAGINLVEDMNPYPDEITGEVVDARDAT